MNSLIADLKLNRFVFSLPWFLVAFLNLQFSYPIPNHSITFWLAVLVSFFGARCLGMSLNQIVDCEFDKRNFRTQERALASGKLSITKAYAVTVASLALLILPIYFLGQKVFLFSLLPITLIITYSWTKRWTPFCHFWLGSIYFFLPTALSVALYGSLHPESIWLGVAIAAFMTAGDLLYAIQDREIDQQEGLKSFPAIFGISKTIWTTRLLVLVAIACLCQLHFFVSAFVLALLWGKFILPSNIKEAAQASQAFQICNTFGGLLLLLTFWIS